MGLDPPLDKKPSLRLIEINNGKALFELSNDTERTVYLFYNPAHKLNEPGKLYRYWLRCEVGGQENTYADYTSHIIPELNPLVAGNVVRFGSESVPATPTGCKISVVYYDDGELARILNERPLDITSEEQARIDSNKKSIEMQFTTGEIASQNNPQAAN